MRLTYKRSEIPVRTRIIEGVLVLGILGLFAAFILPSYLENVRIPYGNCISNLKQLGTTVAIYQSDNEDVYPPYFTFDGPEKTQKFIDVTVPYAKNTQLYLCNLDGDSKKTGLEGLPGKMSYVHSLFLEGVIPNFNKGSRGLSSRAKTFPDTAKTPYLRDPIRGFGTSPGKDGSPAVTGFLSPHGGGFNIGFLDTHAKFKRPIDEFTEL